MPPKRVLIVDDNKDAADTLAQLLQLDGHETQAAYSSNEALENVQRFGPDIILLDIVPDEAVEHRGAAARDGGTRH